MSKELTCEQICDLLYQHNDTRAALDAWALTSLSDTELLDRLKYIIQRIPFDYENNESGAV